MSERFAVTTGAIGELFFNVQDAVAIARPGRVIAWNPSAEALFGVPAAMATQTGADLAPVFGSGVDRFWELVAAGGQAVIECHGGSERILEATAWHLGDDEGRPTVVVLHDITADRRHAKNLATLNALARELLAESSLDVLLTRIVDAAKDLARADFSALITVREGTTEVEQFVYNAPRELFPARLPRVVGLLAVPVATRTVARIDDIRGHPAGEGIPVEHPPIAALLAAPVVRGDEVVGELAVANRPDRPPFDEVDEAMITELASHAAIAMSLVKSREIQQQAETTRRALMDTALHNIRTPLTVATGFLATLRHRSDGLTQDERRQAFDAIERAHERIQSLAEGGLLDHPLTESEGRPIETIAVAGLGARLVADAAASHPEVVLRFEAEPDAPTHFDGDPHVVRDLLDGVVGNALKHAPPGSEVTVTVRREGDSVRLDVSDHGPGIPPEEQGRVFEQFYRTRQSVLDGVPGTGLGLWIVRRLSDLSGGTVGLSSRSGEGTTFWVTFPLAPG
jgi:signal transduction histidine kinase